jgi:polysaccharide export outer membrane protein
LAVLLLLCVAGAVAAQGNEYRLKPRDGIGIFVRNEPMMGGNNGMQVSIDPEGNLSLPLIGVVPAAGMTIAELEAEVTERLKEYIKEPDVYITVVTADLPKIGLYGDGIKQQGVYRVKEGDRIADVITAAGGLVEYADMQGASLMRRGADKPIPLNLELLFKKGDFSQNLEVYDGDYIMVPIDEERKYIVGGFVMKPGMFPLLREKVSVFDAIAAAGGPNARGDLSRVYVTRGWPDSPEQIVVDLDKIIKHPDLAAPVDVTVQPGDVIWVYETKTPNWGLIASQVSAATNLYYLYRMIALR